MERAARSRVFRLCILVYVGTSLLTPPPPCGTVDGICWDHPLAFLRGRITGRSDPAVAALVLFVVVSMVVRRSIGCIARSRQDVPNILADG